MRFIALTLALLSTTADVPAFAMPDAMRSSATNAAPDGSIEETEWLDLTSPYRGRVGQFLAQEDTSDERVSELDQQIAELDRQRAEISLAGPIVLGLLGVGAAALGVAQAASVTKKCQDARDDPTKECRDDNAATKALGWGVVACMGAGIAIFNGLNYFSRHSEIQSIDAKQTELRNERDRLQESLSSLTLGSDTRHGSKMLTLSFDF